MSRWAMILQGSRPLTWALSLCPVFIAAIVSRLDMFVHRLPLAAHDSFFGLYVFLCCMVAVSLQISANYVNDYLDGKRGIDRNRDESAPIRVNGFEQGMCVAAGGAVIFAGIGVVAGVIAVGLSKQYWLIGVGVLSVCAIWAYSAWLSAAGLGEVLAFVFFGPLVICSCVWLFAGASGPWTAIASVQTGVVAASVLLINNLRDQFSDAEVGKKTMVVRWGSDVCVKVCKGLLVFPAVSAIAQMCGCLLAVGLRVPAWIVLFALIVTVMSVGVAAWANLSLEMAQIDSKRYAQTFLAANAQMILLTFAYVVVLLVVNPA